MKKLILCDHLGNLLLELEAFVEGQDLIWQSPKPIAFWLGSIYLVDKALELKPEASVVYETPVSEAARIKEEVTRESEKVRNQSTGEQGSSEASELESAEGLPKRQARGTSHPTGKRARKPKAA